MTMAQRHRRTAAVLQIMVPLLVVMFVVPYCAAETISRFSRGHIASAKKQSSPSGLRTRRHRALKEPKTDTPTRSPDPATFPSSLPDDETPLTTSSFGLIPPEESSHAPTLAPVPTTVLVDREFRQEKTRSESERPRRGRRLVAILVPVLTVSVLGLAFAVLLIARRYRPRNEVYAELESDSSSSHSVSISPPDNKTDDDDNNPDDAPPMTAPSAAPQFVLPSLTNFVRKVAKGGGGDDDRMGMHVERLEIADAGTVIRQQEEGVSFFAGALQLALALEQALEWQQPQTTLAHDDGIKDDQQPSSDDVSSSDSLQTQESDEHSEDTPTSTDDPCYVRSGTSSNDSTVEMSRSVPHPINEAELQHSSGLCFDDVELAFDTSERNKFSTWEDKRRYSRTSWLEEFSGGNEGKRASDDEPFDWKFSGTESWDPAKTIDNLELRYSETAETDVSSSSCSSSIP